MKQKQDIELPVRCFWTLEVATFCFTSRAWFPWVLTREEFGISRLQVSKRSMMVSVAHHSFEYAISRDLTSRSYFPIAILSHAGLHILVWERDFKNFLELFLITPWSQFAWYLLPGASNFTWHSLNYLSFIAMLAFPLVVTSICASCPLAPLILVSEFCISRHKRIRVSNLPKTFAPNSSQSDSSFLSLESSSSIPLPK